MTGRKSYPYKHSTLSLEACQRRIRDLFNYYEVEAFTFGESLKEQIMGIEFQYKGQRVRLNIDIKACANRILFKEPWSNRKRCSENEYRKRVLERAKMQSYRILVNWLEVSFSLVELGIFKFMDIFLPHYVLTDGKGNEAILGSIIEKAIGDGRLQKLLPKGEEEREI